MSDPTPQELALREHTQQLEARIEQMQLELDRLRAADTEPPPPPNSLHPDDDTGRTRVDALSDLVSIVDYLKGEFEGIKSHMAAQKAPPWAKELFNDLLVNAAENERLSRELSVVTTRLERLPCWRHTLPPGCPLDVIDGGKTAGE